MPTSSRASTVNFTGTPFSSGQDQDFRTDSAFHAHESICRGDISDGHSWISVIIDDGAVRSLEKDSGRKIAQLLGGLVTLKAFSLLINRNGPQHGRLMLVIESAKYRQGSSKSGSIGSPLCLSEHEHAQNLLRALRQLDSEKQRGNDHFRPNLEAANINAHDRPSDSHVQQHSSTATKSFENQTREEVCLASQASIISPLQVVKSASQAELTTAQSINAAPPVGLAPVKSTEEARRKLLGMFPANQKQAAQRVQFHRPWPIAQAQTSLVPLTRLPKATPQPRECTPVVDSGVDDNRSMTEDSVNTATAQGAPLQEMNSVVDGAKLSLPPPTDPGQTITHEESYDSELRKSETVAKEVPLTEAPSTAYMTSKSAAGRMSPQPSNVRQLSPQEDPLEKRQSNSNDQKSRTFADRVTRVPDLKFLKYARRKIPNDQAKVLNDRSSWLPSYPGERFSHSNVPLSVLEFLRKAKLAPETQVDEVTEKNERHVAVDHKMGNDPLERLNPSQVVSIDPVLDTSMNHESSGITATPPKSSQLSWSQSPPQKQPSREGIPPNSSDVSTSENGDAMQRSSPLLSASSSDPVMSGSGEGSDDDLPTVLPHRLEISSKLPRVNMNSHKVEVKASPLKSSVSVKNVLASQPVPATQLPENSSILDEKSALPQPASYTSPPLASPPPVSSPLVALQPPVMQPASSQLEDSKPEAPQPAFSQPESSQPTSAQPTSPQRSERIRMTSSLKRRRQSLAFDPDEAASQDPSKKHAKMKRDTLHSKYQESRAVTHSDRSSPLSPSHRSTRSFGSQTALSFLNQKSDHVYEDQRLSSANNVVGTQITENMAEHDEMRNETERPAERPIDRESEHASDDLAMADETVFEMEMEQDAQEVSDLDTEVDAFSRATVEWSSTTFGDFGQHYHSLATVQGRMSSARRTSHVDVLGWKFGAQDK
ncbi:hypothetical protein ANO11243_074900 [Dothideomycetidae sp. 11243]|nr:hypothetical protein ANO11243_074900 [fungal sp. No.11243]